MHGLLKRAGLTVLATLTLTASAAGTAHAEDITVSGCYGVQSAVVCDFTVTYVTGVAFTEHTEVATVCLGGCTDIPVTFPVPSADPHVCLSWTDRAGTPTSFCVPTEQPPDLGQPVFGLVNAALDILNENAFSQIDPTLCPLIGAFAPGLPGIVDVTPEGDIYVDGEFFWDCPPYASA